MVVMEVAMMPEVPVVLKNLPIKEYAKINLCKSRKRLLTKTGNLPKL